MTLLDHARRIAAADAAADNTRAHDPISQPADDAAPSYVEACLGGSRDTRDVLPLIALLDALGPAGLRRIRAQPGLGLVVQVPSPDWAVPVETALRGLADFAEIIARTGKSKSYDTPVEGNPKVSRLLSGGAKVAGICHAPERHLPAALVQGADLVVRIGPVSNRTIAHAIRSVTGKRLRTMPPAVAAGLDFDSIAAAIRLGSSPKECIARLQAAAAVRSGAETFGTDVPGIETVSGYGAAKSWALALVADLEEWRAGRLDWSAVNRTCLLQSEPGLGKSSLIRSIAKSAKVPLVSTSVAELFTSSNGHLDGVLKALEAKVSQAAAQAPAILFIDEVDSIPNRQTMDNRGRDWWTPVVNGLLTCLDSTASGPASSLIVIGATNHAAMLDPALVRPGRLHPVIRIERPDAEALAGILRQHLGVDLSEANLWPIAHLGVGASGADVVSWVKGARAAARREGRRMVPADLIAQVAPVDGRTEVELGVCARHEAAHCLAAEVLDVAKVSSVTIAMGRTSAGCAQANFIQRAFLTKAQIENIVVVTLAGRAMDALGGAPTTGAGGGRSSDLARATRYLLDIHTNLGLGESLVYRGDAADALRYDPLLRDTIDGDLIRLYAVACAFVREHRTAIEAIADRLVAARVLSGDEVAAIIRAHRKPATRQPRGGRHAG